MQIRNKKKILLKIYNRIENENSSCIEAKSKIEDEEKKLTLEIISKINNKKENNPNNFLEQSKSEKLNSLPIKTTNKVKIFNISPLFKKSITKNFNNLTSENKKITFTKKTRINSLDPTILENNIKYQNSNSVISKNTCNCDENCLSENCRCHVKNFTCNEFCNCMRCFNIPLLKKKIKKRKRRLVSYFGLKECEVFKSFNRINDVYLYLKKDFKEVEVGNDFVYDRTGSFYLRKLNF